MNSATDEALYFRYCRTLDGRLVSLDTARHNGRLVPRFDPGWTELPDESDEGELDELVAEVSQNLSPTERRTWLKLIDGQSILDIAADEGVSRTAVYERIRGNSKGHGGMIAKNEYVAIWWRLRQAAEQAGRQG